jgi:hypothetical protein
VSLILPRRKFLIGLGTVMAAPAIVRAESLMKLPKREIIKPAMVPEEVAGQLWIRYSDGIDLKVSPIMRADGSAHIAAGDLRPGTLVALCFDGRNWRMMS